MDIKQETLDIGAYHCKLFATASPEVILIQPSARHEEKSDGIRREIEQIANQAEKNFALLMFDTKNWARALMPWHDDAVSREEAVGLHAHDTLYDIEHSLLPWLRTRYGCLPCIIGGYSLGGLFALWAARESDTFAAAAAASPSLWIREWKEYAVGHQVNASYVYLSLGDREEHCRNERMKRIGDCVRQEHQRLVNQLNGDHTTLEWNTGGHFGEEAERTARAFCWCMNKL